jgi:hypothetical protein
VDPFLWGAIGAVAPEIVRWYRITKTGTPEEWKRAGYWIATLAYLALGGLMAVLVAKDDPYAEFIAGLSTEFVIVGAREAAMHGRDVAGEEFASRPARFHDKILASFSAHASYLARRP